MFVLWTVGACELKGVSFSGGDVMVGFVSWSDCAGTMLSVDCETLFLLAIILRRRCWRILQKGLRLSESARLEADRLTRSVLQRGWTLVLMARDMTCRAYTMLVAS